MDGFCSARTSTNAGASLDRFLTALHSALRRWEIKLLPGEIPHDFSRPDQVLAALSSFTDTSDLTIWRSAVYRFHALVAQRWRVGRVFLMGDAVHQTPPFLGQGLCAGIRDAANLAWKLALVLEGKASESLLDSYEVERIPHVRTVIAAAKEFGEIIGELDPVAARSRDKRLRDELKSGQAQTIRQKFIPDLAGGLIAADTPLAGSLFIQPNAIRSDGTTIRLDELLGSGFAIVAGSREPLDRLSSKTRRMLNDLGTRLLIVGDHSLDGESEHIVVAKEQGCLFANWTKEHDIVAAIVRPDKIVFGAAADGDALEETVQQLFRLLGVR